jgi:hypothetical protein
MHNRRWIWKLPQQKGSVHHSTQSCRYGLHGSVLGTFLWLRYRDLQ